MLSHTVLFALATAKCAGNNFSLQQQEQEAPLQQQEQDLPPQQQQKQAIVAVEAGPAPAAARFVMKLDTCVLVFMSESSMFVVYQQSVTLSFGCCWKNSISDKGTAQTCPVLSERLPSCRLAECRASFAAGLQRRSPGAPGEC